MPLKFSNMLSSKVDVPCVEHKNGVSYNLKLEKRLCWRYVQLNLHINRIFEVTYIESQASGLCF
jgi:hypothetical protein